MKKHIRKKFLLETKLQDDVVQVIENSQMAIPVGEVHKHKPRKGDQGWMLTEQNYFIRSFPYTHHGKNRWIPEPDPVLIYFHTAYVNFKSIEPMKTKIFDSLSAETLTEHIINELYAFFGATNGYVISLFTALEAFINRQIPDDYMFQDVKNNRTEVYNKDQIQRHLSFDVKLKKVLVNVTGKDFMKKYGLKAIHIQNLKDLRDNIVHTKPKKDGHTPYDYLYKTALNFKYEETMDAVADFFNFYQPDYIEPCPCNEKF